MKRKLHHELTFAVQCNVRKALRVPEVGERCGQVGPETVPFQAVLLLLGVHHRASYSCPVDKERKVSASLSLKLFPN